jgi:hypothetical protein
MKIFEKKTLSEKERKEKKASKENFFKALADGFFANILDGNY